MTPEHRLLDTALAGVDFSSAPSRRKPITVAHGHTRDGVLRLERVDAHAGFASFAAWLAAPGAWVAAFDFPFGLPRELAETLARERGWPLEWAALMRAYANTPRAALRERFKAFCAARPAGDKFAHRATDRPAGSSPSMKWVNPPVAWMMHAGVPLLLDAGVHLPGLHDGERARVALEGYPGLLARELIGRRSYKSDAKAQQTPERLIARKDLIEALEQGRTRFGLRLKLSHAQRDDLAADPSADRLDAVLCLMQAAWAAMQPDWGMPHDADPLEGWIVGAAAR